MGNAGCLWNILNTVGALAGGLGALGAVIAAIWTAWSVVPNELASFRASKADERRGEAAQHLWGASFRLFRELEALCLPANIAALIGAPHSDKHGETNEKDAHHLSPDEHYDRRTSGTRHRIETASDALLESWGVAALHLPEKLLMGVDSLWMLRSSILFDHEMYHSLHKMRPAGTLQVGSEGLCSKERHDELVATTKRIWDDLGPIARHGQPMLDFDKAIAMRSASKERNASTHSAAQMR
ncbi:hypothetical protein [Myxococcus xanthus]|uniref:Uncharacterized protein n=1 Tax=Myxococcus xanthus TaxID=34 RepID=A0A7Y4IMD4_MYXXA|nr:hypothetical protein [Myxococcus xanthus]NOJ81918.1 hypothetical protein [Myxococcus xanthus]NOJ89342.1 hypothetical protein [Myxococcus xanthus]